MSASSLLEALMAWTTGKISIDHHFSALEDSREAAKVLWHYSARYGRSSV